MARNQTYVQVTGDGEYKLYHESGPFIDPEVRWGATGNATMHIGSRCAGIAPDEILESWIQENGQPAVFGDTTTDPNYPERSAVIIGLAEMIIVKVENFSQPFTIRVLDKNFPEKVNRLSQLEDLPFTPIGGGSSGPGGII